MSLRSGSILTSGVSVLGEMKFAFSPAFTIYMMAEGGLAHQPDRMIPDFQFITGAGLFWTSLMFVLIFAIFSRAIIDCRSRWPKTGAIGKATPTPKRASTKVRSPLVKLKTSRSDLALARLSFTKLCAASAKRKWPGLLSRRGGRASPPACRSAFIIGPGGSAHALA